MEKGGRGVPRPHTGRLIKVKEYHDYDQALTPVMLLGKHV